MGRLSKTNTYHEEPPKAEENFYYSRQNALSLINKEHQKNINKALGVDIAKSKGLARWIYKTIKSQFKGILLKKDTIRIFLKN